MNTANQVRLNLGNYCFQELLNKSQTPLQKHIKPFSLNIFSTMRF